ncbi:MAG: nitroreductase family protein [Planctomycetes bacterium]|nr:nitroreductase family protein [Planctomycetota bacterium]
MELREVLGRRRSIRFVKPYKPVETEKIQMMFEAARIASHWGNVQSLGAVAVHKESASQEVIDSLKATIVGWQIKFAPVVIVWYIDPEMVEEILTTLLDNAIRHNPAGTEVVAELGSRDGSAVVRVSDNGKGMAPEVVSRIFDEGARAGGAGASRGTGMGLYIAKLLTEMNRMGEAIAHLSAVHPPAIAQYNMGVLLEQRGRTAEAIHFLTAASHINPQLQSASKMLTNLQGDLPESFANDDVLPTPMTLSNNEPSMAAKGPGMAVGPRYASPVATSNRPRPQSFPAEIAQVPMGNSPVALPPVR